MNATLRIFANAKTRSSLHRPGRPAPPIVDVVEHHEDELAIANATEQRLIDVLAAAPAFGETISVAYQRKEHTLAEIFASLPRSESAALMRRLSDPHAGDVLAAHFARLVVERRTRLLAILADAPRREARRR
jgi:hypothetical protein